jgi:hypothetical protein
MELNEPLRLSPQSLNENIALAEKGDRSAAKKLWHHYEFVEADMPKAHKWKSMYEQLQQKQ